MALKTVKIASPPQPSYRALGDGVDLPLREKPPPLLHEASCGSIKMDRPTASITPGSNGTKVPVGTSLRVRRTFDLRMQEQTFGAHIHVIMRWQTDDPGPERNCGMGMGWAPSSVRTAPVQP